MVSRGAGIACCSAGGRAHDAVLALRLAVELVNYLLHRAEERFGPDGRKALVNDFDTATTRTTPLMCAARTRVGHLNDRLKIVQLLVMAGADSALQDSYGDNCLHWAARLR